MSLSYDLISQFAKITNDSKKIKKEIATYGTIVKYNNANYVKMDGSNLLTPYTSTVTLKDGDRVIVSVKNHTVTVTGSTNNPSASNNDLQETNDKVSKFNKIVADKITADQLEVINGYFEQILAISGKYEDLQSVTAEIETLKATYAKIENINANDVEAINAEIESIKSKFLESTTITTEDLNAANAQLTNITAYNANFTYVSAEKLKTINANITDLQANKASITELNAVKANIENLDANKADISDLNAREATILDLLAAKATILDLQAAEADILQLQTNKLDAEEAELKYVNIDFGNIDVAWIGRFFSESGIIKNVQTEQGYVSGQLYGVTINGDMINANSIKADKLVILGEDGAYYKLNIDGLNNISTEKSSKFILLTVEPDNWKTNYTDYYVINNNNYVHLTDNEAPTWQDNTYYKLSSIHGTGLDGTNIIAQTITADKITVSDLVAFGATIGGFHITNNAIYSGTKSSATNTTRGIYMDNTGQLLVGDSNNYFKYYYDSVNNKFKLEISASSIFMKASSRTLDDVIEDLENNINNIDIGGRNLLLGTAEAVADVGIGTGEIINEREEEEEEEEEEEYDKTVWDMDFGTNMKGVKTNIAKSGRYMNFKSVADRFGFLEGDKLVVSVYIKADQKIIGNLALRRSNTTEPEISKEFEIDTSWKQFWFKFTADAGSLISETARIEFDSNTNENCLYWAGWKLEKGTLPTDWSPAPEDINEDVGELQQNMNNTNAEFQTSISENTANIERMNEEKANKDDVNNTNSELEEKVNNALSLIAQLENKIVTAVFAGTNSTMITQKGDSWQLNFGSYEVTDDDKTTVNRYFNTILTTVDKYDDLKIDTIDPDTHEVIQISVKSEIENLQTLYIENNIEDIESIKIKIENIKNRISESTITSEDLETVNDNFNSIINYNDNINYKSAFTSIDSYLALQAQLDKLDLNNIDEISKTMSNYIDDLDKLSELEEQLKDVDLSDMNNLANLAGEISQKTAYIKMSQDSSGNPVMDLGSQDANNPFKVRITNTSIDFMYNNEKLAYANNEAFYAKKLAAEEELYINNGNMAWVWKTRENGNLGLSYVKKGV